MPFEDTGPTEAWLLVFPRTPVIIQHAGREPVLTDATRVMFYNRGQEYRRRSVAGLGDECEWFAFDPSLIADAMRALDPAVDDRGDRPFTLTHGPSDAEVYLLQRRIVEHLVRDNLPDLLFVEEAMLRILARVTATALGRERPPFRAHRLSTRREHEGLAQACRLLLAERLAEPLSLHDVARAVGASPFHVARVFQRETGTTLHAYRQELRLRGALERIAGASLDLARIAVDLGFATHSHFTSAFHRTFGMTPSAWRGKLDGRVRAETSKILTARAARGGASSRV
jgi:AraC-like DNA-binding protein